jgi:hypothetical protein
VTFGFLVVWFGVAFGVETFLQLGTAADDDVAAPGVGPFTDLHEHEPDRSP